MQQEEITLSDVIEKAVIEKHGNRLYVDLLGKGDGTKVVIMSDDDKSDYDVKEHAYLVWMERI